MQIRHHQTVRHNNTNYLTEARPNTARSTYTSITDVLALTGMRTVLSPETAMANPRTRLPPNLSASHPPGICVIIYPQKNAARIDDCVFLSHSNSALCKTKKFNVIMILVEMLLTSLILAYQFCVPCTCTRFPTSYVVLYIINIQWFEARDNCSPCQR